jgi:hypothetical protein
MIAKVKKIVTKLILLCLIVCMVELKVYATNIQVLMGAGFLNQAKQDESTDMYIQGGGSFVHEYTKNSALGIDVSIDYVFKDKENQEEENIFSTNVLFLYRYYPGHCITKKTKVDTFEPFLSIGVGSLILDNEDVVPGVQAQVGIDIVYENFLLDPFSIINYPMTLLSKTSPLLTFALTAGVYYKEGEKYIQTGIKIYTGTFF